MKLRRFSAAAGAATLALTAALAVPAIGAAPTKPAAKPAAQPKVSPNGPSNLKPIEPVIGPIDTQAKHALVLEADTNTVLLDKLADERIPPASMSKVMTAYVVFSMLKEGRAKLTDKLPVSEKAWRTGGSKMFVPLGENVTIEDLLQGMIVQSGNDACIVLAEGLAGSEQAFVDIMNEKAKQLGLTGSHFADVDGLPNPEHYMTARDLAKLGMHIIKDFPEYYHYFAEKEFTFNKIKQGNRNPLLYANIGADGLKTGHTEEAGYSLLGSVHRGDRRVIIVLNGLPSAKARIQESERLVEWAFREYKDYKLFTAGTNVDNADVWLGTDATVPMTVAKDLTVTLSRKARKDMKVAVVRDEPLAAPIEKGQRVGKVVVTAADAKPVEAPLVAAADVERLGPFGRAAMIAAHLVWGDRH